MCAGAVPAPCEASLLHAGRGRHQGRPQGIAHRYVDPDPHGSSLFLVRWIRIRIRIWVKSWTWIMMHGVARIRSESCFGQVRNIFRMRIFFSRGDPNHLLFKFNLINNPWYEPKMISFLFSLHLYGTIHAFMWKTSWQTFFFPQVNLRNIQGLHTGNTGTRYLPTGAKNCTVPFFLLPEIRSSKKFLF